MPSDNRLSTKDRRAVLKQLHRDRLAELTTHFALAVTDRRSIDAHVDAIIRKRSLEFREVLEQLRRDELQELCAALGLGAAGREKAKLVDRILRVKEQEEPEVLGTTSDFPPPSGRGGSAVKSLLRRFVIRTAAEYLGRDSTTSFISRLLECFGWPESGPPDAEMPASLHVIEGGQRATRNVALSWPTRRVLVDVVKHDVMLDYAWRELLRVCLQADPVPQYVVLTNQRELHLYDLARDREAPRLAVALDDLPKYSEAFPFFSTSWVPGTTPQIINVSKVSGEVAGLVAKLYRSLKDQHPGRERDVVQFTLQCILTMFAEDIGLLPQEYFTTLLYDGKRHGDVEKRLTELFRTMATRDVSAPRAVPYFNGGLFTKPVTLPLGEAQLGALTKASEANWKYVDPHIFGSVFQGIMNDAERHKSGAHYTAHEDIMRVVGPTIVEPWRKRIRGASSLAELLEVRKALLAFRVLDPACGSGNFLYVSFRELYKLDTELLARIREFPSTEGGSTRIAWGSGIQTARFFGIDINPFAVELAKVTLNIAKKIAFDERRETAADLFGQVEIDLDPSLPLDNLDKNIVCADALFTEWPEVDAIVGNPPFTSGTNIRGELGPAYLTRLRETFNAVGGRADYCSYWFRRAHDCLVDGGRAGLVGTSGIRIGSTREASLDYLVANGGVIVNAVSSRIWPGDAAVNVSMVNWVRGSAEGPYELLVGDQVFPVERIPTHLQLHADVGGAKSIAANAAGTSEGINFAHPAFRLSAAEVSALELDRVAASCIRPVATGDDLLRGRIADAPDFCVDLRAAKTEDAARAMGGPAFERLKSHVYPTIKERAESGKETNHYATWLRKWWKPQQPRDEFFRRVAQMGRIIVCPKVSTRPAFAFISTRFVPNNTMRLIAVDDDYSFGVVQSSPHWAWTRAKGGRTRADINYTTEVWETFPWPQEPSEEEVAAVAIAARALRHVRTTLMRENGWSPRALYQAAEVPGPHPLKDAQNALDEAVRRAYGIPDGQDATEFLLELNKLVAEDEAEGRVVQGPGLPRRLEPGDPRWTSDDCIEPPAG